MTTYRKEKLQKLYKERYSREELFIMYRDWLFKSDELAKKQLSKILKEVWRWERI